MKPAWTFGNREWKMRKCHCNYRPRSEGDNVLGSVRPSVRPLTAEPFDLRVVQRAKRSHYQSEVFVCVSNNHADAVDQLLI